ncbi:carbohydrate sulfotransferase 11-like [Anthonomus grandis grandis]|uniref:carbohydrate sulfotransferase 11-like n=1 Tax=Anthonomus grandis grandis TaxID=2921223 RepID=UPI0021663FBE|nr:carbohydrate sulfotransferase 11-like [Anthonomus grandis grandis]XP_050298937.1 carbohydrate sulfotransferase 11-like [Anthonomus grandis grandis]
MRLRKIKRSHHGSGWRVIRRCVIFFTAICFVPVFLVFMVATDHYVRPDRHRLSFSMQKPFRDYPDAHVASLKNHSMPRVLNRLENRHKHLKRACHILGLDKPGNDSLHKPNPWEYLVDNKHHLVWCNVFKAASTSWMYNFNILAGYPKNFLQKSHTPPLTLARKKYGRPTLETLQKALGDNNAVSFLIVRHPLERLLSAYRDKIQYAVASSYHFKLGKDIIKRYRKNKNAYRPRYPTYSEFVQWLVDSASRGKPLDMHWTPVTEFCTPCMFNIKFIAHTETLEEDQEYIIKHAGLQDVIRPEWRNAGKGSTTAHISSHYSQLTRSQILQLYHIFRFDFELFNYSLTGYLEVGQPDQDPSALLAAITLKDNNPNSIPHIY